MSTLAFKSFEGGRKCAVKKTTYRFSTMDSYGRGAYLSALHGSPSWLIGSVCVRPLPIHFLRRDGWTCVLR